MHRIRVKHPTGPEIGVYGVMALKQSNSFDIGVNVCRPPGEELNQYDTDGSRSPPCPTERNASAWRWRDWLFVGSPSTMMALAAMTSKQRVYFDKKARCAGLTPEDQTILQLAHAGVRPRRLNLPLRMRKLHVSPCATAPLLNASEMEVQHGIRGGWYAPCPAVAKGCLGGSNSTAKKP